LILHRSTAQAKGRALAEKMKQLIPRQLFEVPIQAAIGNKGDRARNGEGAREKRNRQVLRRRHHAQTKVLETEGRQEADEEVGRVESRRRRFSQS
jgi:GTP-binding protein LepA